MKRAMTTPPSGSTATWARSLGFVGVLGGLGLLAAFVVQIPSGINWARLFLFFAGGMAVVLAVHPWHRARSARLALVGAVPVLMANGVMAGWELLAMGRERPFAGDFGLAGFWAGLAMWLAAAWFGLVALRIGVLWRPATLCLAVGSLLAIAGMDRLELTSAANPTVFGTIGLAGVAMNGLAWVLLGVQVVLGDRRILRAAGTPPVTVGR